MQPTEELELALVKESIQPGDRVLEGGAGSGIITRWLLEQGVLRQAYEPHSGMFQYLESWLPDFTVSHAALANRVGFSHLNEGVEWWNSSLVGEPQFGGVERRWPVPIYDAEMECFFHVADTLVLDIEGSEAAVVVRAAPVVSKVVMEVHPSLLLGDELQAMEGALRSNDFYLRERVQMDHPLGNYLDWWER